MSASGPANAHTSHERSGRDNVRPIISDLLQPVNCEKFYENNFWREERQVRFSRALAKSIFQDCGGESANPLKNAGHSLATSIFTK